MPAVWNLGWRAEGRKKYKPAYEHGDINYCHGIMSPEKILFTGTYHECHSVV